MVYQQGMAKPPSIAVIGAGVVGLSTAVCIKEKIPSADVTIFADKLGDDTLSSGAGGLFRPEASIDLQEENVLKWCKLSLKHFLGICSSPEAGVAGVQLVSGYFLSTAARPLPKDGLLKKLLPLYCNVTKKELENFPSKFVNGVFFTTVVADCRFYLTWLRRRFENAGGKIELRHIDNLFEISAGFDIIVNCAGLGAKHLMNDNQLVPIRGQTIKVKAPWVKHFYYGDDVYIIPGMEYVTLGGIKDYGSWDLNVNSYQKQFIWDKCSEILPSLQNAEIMWDWVGLRPYRPRVCLESCIIENKGKFVKVVNNYGHGGHGVTLSWGTALEAAELTQKLLANACLLAKL